MTDDAIREVHGMACRDNQNKHAIIAIREGEECIVFDSAVFSGTSMTPWQARYLSAKLYRIARRIRTRTESAS